MKLKAILGASAAAVAMAFASSAMAQTYPDFTVTPNTFYNTSTQLPFVADKIIGNYVEVITFTPSNAQNTAGTFSISLLFDADAFVANDGKSSLDAGRTDLGVSYDIYATFMSTGSYTSNGTQSQFSLTPGGSLNVYFDNLNDNAFTAPASGTGTFGITNTGDDLLLATGGGLFGAGRIDCIGSNNCGSFGQTTSFSLTPFGSAFFTSPVPFYPISLESGQFNGFAPTGTVTINGSMDVIFAPVPEPASLALVGLALAGLAATSRKKKV
jgi:hypothetical protein